MPWFMFSVAGGEQVLLEMVVMMIVIVVLVMWIEQRAFLGTIVNVQVAGYVNLDFHGGHFHGVVRVKIILHAEATGPTEKLEKRCEGRNANNR